MSFGSIYDGSKCLLQDYIEAWIIMIIRINTGSTIQNYKGARIINNYDN